jgi:hypothetical protein
VPLHGEGTLAPAALIGALLIAAAVPPLLAGALHVFGGEPAPGLDPTTAVVGVEHAETEHLGDLLAPAEWALKQAREQGSDRVGSRRAE